MWPFGEKTEEYYARAIQKQAGVLEKKAKAVVNEEKKKFIQTEKIEKITGVLYHDLGPVFTKIQEFYRLIEELHNNVASELRSTNETVLFCESTRATLLKDRSFAKNKVTETRVIKDLDDIRSTAAKEALVSIKELTQAKEYEKYIKGVIDQMGTIKSHAKDLKNVLKNVEKETRKVVKEDKKMVGEATILERAEARPTPSATSQRTLTRSD